jgi:hypothetical protein
MPGPHPSARAWFCGRLTREPRTPGPTWCTSRLLTSSCSPLLSVVTACPATACATDALGLRGVSNAGITNTRFAAHSRWRYSTLGAALG